MGHHRDFGEDPIKHWEWAVLGVGPEEGLPGSGRGAASIRPGGGSGFGRFGRARVVPVGTREVTGRQHSAHVGVRTQRPLPEVQLILIRHRPIP